MADTSLPNGFAIRRNGSCLAAEVDCGATVAPFHACCPSSTTCPTQYNAACCQSGQNCTLPLIAKPHCANSSWTMFDNNGFFCCDPGSTGYAVPDSGSDGCLPALLRSTPTGILLLASISQTGLPVSQTSLTTSASTKPTTSISSGSTSSSTSAATSAATSAITSAATSATSLPATPSNAASQGSNSLGTGAIAGIVVGIVVGVIILLLAGCLLYRRRNRAAPAPLMSSRWSSGGDKQSRGIFVHELQGAERQEMPDTGWSMGTPDSKHRGFTELPGADVEAEKRRY